MLLISLNLNSVIYCTPVTLFILLFKEYFNTKDKYAYMLIIRILKYREYLFIYYVCRNGGGG